MYGHDNNNYNTNEMFPYSTDFPSQFQFFHPLSFPTVSQPPPSPFPIPISDFDPFLALRSEFSHSSSSSSGFTSPTNQGINQYGSPISSLPTTPLRRKLFSTDDLQGMKVVQYHSNRSESPLQHDLSIIGGMSKACKYSPEEKKDKIERYRSKRNQRNFNKKIKYECRKTLADSRQRIRGRFARNDEIDCKNFPNQWDQAVVEEDDENWISFLMQHYQQM